MFFSDRHDRVFPVSTHHVRVQVGHDALNRHWRVVGKVLATPKTLLLSAHENEHQRPPGSGMQRGKGFGCLDHGNSSRSVVVGPVVDTVAVHGVPHAYMIHVAAECHVLVAEYGVAPFEDGHDVRSGQFLDGLIFEIYRHVETGDPLCLEGLVSSQSGRCHIEAARLEWTFDCLLAHLDHGYSARSPAPGLAKEDPIQSPLSGAPITVGPPGQDHHRRRPLLL